MERHHGAGSVVPFSVQVGNDIFFRFYLTTKKEIAPTAATVRAVITGKPLLSVSTIQV